MNKLQILFMKNECIKFAANEGLKIVQLDSIGFTAEDSECVVSVDWESLAYFQKNGWDLQDCLHNETNYKGES